MENKPFRGIPATLAARRHHLGMSQDEVARIAGITQKTFSTMERGVADPRLSTLEGAARVMGLHIRMIPRELLPYVDDLLRPLMEGGLPTREGERPLYFLDDGGEGGDGHGTERD